MDNGKNILVLTREYSCKVRKNDRMTMVVAEFAEQWAKENNVLVIVNSARFPSFYYFFLGLAKGLIAKLYGKDASLLNDRSLDKPFEFNDGPIKVYNLPRLKFFPHAPYFRFQLKKQVKEIERILSDNQFVPDIIDGHWISPQLDLIQMLKEHYGEAKTALVLHTEAVRSEYYTKKNKSGLEKLDYVGCRSRVGAETLYKGLKLKTMPFVCASGIPDSYFNNLVEEKVIHVKNCTISTVSRLLNWKCLDATILGVSKAFSNGDYEYNIFGAGSEKEHLETIIKGNHLENHVHLRGKVSRDEVIEQMKRTDIFVMISLQETFGLVYLEAMAQGCITIASIDGGVDGIIVDGYNGFLSKEGDADALSECLKRIQLLSDEDLKTISNNAMKTAREYTHSKVGARYLAEISK